jgi:hypothetical protein
MESKPKLHPNVIESHTKIIAWNEYVMDYLGLRLEKQNRPDYRSLDLYQGALPLYHTGSAKITKTVNAQLHRNLKSFLEAYFDHLQKFPGLPRDFEFHPPKVNEP